MTDCRVTCRVCVTDAGPKVWRWLCEECASDCQDRHRADTGHATELLVVPDESFDDFLVKVKRVAW